jgi:hypothetical protein
MSWIFALLGLATAIAGGGAMVMGWPLVPLERGWTLVIAGAALASGGLVCLALAALMGETRRTRRMIERALAEVAWARPIERASATTLPLEPEAAPSRPAERPFTPSVATSFGLDKVEPVMPMMPMMPAAAPLGSVDPAPEAKPATARPEPAREGSGPSSVWQSAIERREQPAAPGASPAAAPEWPAPEPARQAEELRPARSFSVGETSFVVFTDGTIEARTPKGARRFGSMEEVRNYLEESASS